MSRFEFALYEIERDTEEHLVKDRVSSAYEAIKACLDRSKCLDFIHVTFAHNDQHFAEISPYATWGTWEEFESQLNTHILATKIQLNIDLSPDKAAEDLLIKTHDNKRLAT